MAIETAHIAHADGRVVLPAQTLYDRQLLVDHVLGYARGALPLRVSVDATTWIVERPDQQRSTTCRGCARRVERVVCHHPRKPAVDYCVACALARPRLTTALLEQLPAATILYDVQAHYAFGGEWIAWTRWPRATPAEILEDLRLQRRFAPVLRWTCTEICAAPAGTLHMQRQGPAAQASTKRSAAPRRALLAR